MKHENIPKWLILPVLFLLVVGLFVPCIASADPATAIMVEPATKVVGIGETFTVDVFVDLDTDIAGAQFSLTFDASLLTADDVTEGNLLSQGGASTYFDPGTINNGAGTITSVAGVITTPGETVSQSEIFATISFTAGSAVGTSALDFSNVMVGDLQGQAVDITVTDGSVTVTGAAAEYVLTMGASPPDGGTATDETGESPYAASAEVSIKAEAAAGWEFVGWTAPAGTFDNDEAEETTFTIPAQDVIVTAHFEEIPPGYYVLTMAASPPNGGTATDETGESPYAAGAEASIKAEAAAGWEFVGWTAPAGTFDNDEAAETTFTMPAQDVTVTAHFEEIPPGYYVLTMVASPPEGGTATDETGASPYEEGDLVNIRAEAAAGYDFVGWTAPAGEFDNDEAAETTFTMPAQHVTVTANFELEVAPPVDGTDHPINKVVIVALSIGGGAAIIVGITLLVRRRRRATR